MPMSDLNARSKAVFAIAGLTSSPAPVPDGTAESPLETFGSNVFDDKAMRRHQGRVPLPEKDHGPRRTA